MEKILEKLANGENSFTCQYNGQHRTCEILQLDVISRRAYVRFNKPVKKIEMQESGFQWGYDVEDIPAMIEVEVDSYEEWINIDNN